MTWTLSEKGLLSIAREESFVPRVYKDFAGVSTIGYGHALKKGETYPETITEAEGLALLRQDVAYFVRVVNDLVQVGLAQGEFDALVSFAFNEGATRFRTSTLLRLLNEGNAPAAAEQFPRWNKYTDPATHEIKESWTLTQRRAREKAMFLGTD